MLPVGTVIYDSPTVAVGERHHLKIVLRVISRRRYTEDAVSSVISKFW